MSSILSLNPKEMCSIVKKERNINKETDFLNKIIDSSLEELIPELISGEK